MSEISIDTYAKSIDIRALTFEAFRGAVTVLQEKSDELKANSIIVITNFGHIFCKFDDNESIDEWISKTILNIRNSELKKIPPETPVVNQCKTLLLKNVTIIPFANPQASFNHNVITIFTDQIVGFSIGKLPDNLV